MKLYQITETTRRDFLKTTAGYAVSGSLLPNVLKQHYRFEYSPELEREMGAMLEGGYTTKVNPSTLADYVVNKCYADKSQSPLTFLAYDDPHNLDEYVGGALSKSLSTLYKDVKPSEIINELVSICGGIDDTLLSALGSAGSCIKSFGAVVNPQFIELVARSKPEEAAKMLSKIGNIKYDTAKNYVNNEKQFKQQSKLDAKAYKEKCEIERRNCEIGRQKFKPHKNIKFNPRADDEIYGSSMHQSFESKIKSIFTI